MIEITESAAENKVNSPVRIAAMNGCGGSWWI